jgi:guanosine-3',5'-bis(diphosphate) 3'-pyrophosphohydrolase
MSNDQASAVRPLAEAVALAARVHEGQIRKDGETPYASHVFRVCLILRHVFDIDDTHVLTAAVLHDVIEDTNTDFDDLEEKFGAEVASWVATLSKDKRLPDAEREKAYIEALAHSGWQVKVCKLADIFDNVLDSATGPREHRQRAFKRAHAYLEGLKDNLPSIARRPWELVSQLVQEAESA